MAALGPGAMKALEELGPVECRGYRATLTPWWCLENQLSIFCLPGWPCHDCDQAVGIRIAGETPAPPKTANRKPKTGGAYDPKVMSWAVARRLGLID